MYDIKCSRKYEFELRIDDFNDRYVKILNSNKKNVIYIKDVFDNSTFRYRAYNVIETMEQSQKYCVTCFLVEELYKIYNLVDKIDIFIMQRAKWSFELSNFIKYLKSKKKIIIYDMDDMIYSTKYVPEYLNSISYYDDISIDSFFALSKRYELIINECNGVIATTDNLVKKINDDLKLPTWILRNYLNKEQIDVSNEIIKLKRDNYDSSKFVIGYFSGSNSHKRDLEVTEQALVKLMNKYDDIYLNIVGYMDLSDNLKELKKKGKVIFSKFVSYEELQYEIGKVDLNIIPLQKHEFNNCKSELKYFEASIVNTLSLATNNDVYKNIIENGRDGFITDELSWFDSLEYIYLNRNRLNDIIDNAREKCHQIYDYDKQLHKIECIYDDIIKELGE